MSAVFWKSRAVTVLILWSAALASGCTKCSSPETCVDQELAEAMKCATTSKMESPNVGALGTAGKVWVNGQHHLTFSLEDAGNTDKPPTSGADVPEASQGSIRKALSFGLRQELTTHIACVLANWAKDGLFGPTSSFKEADAFENPHQINCGSSANNVFAACKKAGIAFETVSKIVESVRVPEQVRLITKYTHVCRGEKTQLQSIGAGLSFGELEKLLSALTQDGALMMWNMCPSTTAMEANECKVIYGHGFYDAFASTPTKYVERYEQAFPVDADGVPTNECVQSREELNNPGEVQGVQTFTGAKNSQGLCAFSTDTAASFVFQCANGASSASFGAVNWHGSTYKDRHGQGNCNIELPVDELCGFSDTTSEQDFVKINAKRLVDDFGLTDNSEVCVAELSTNSDKSCSMTQAYDMAAINMWLEEAYDEAVFQILDEWVDSAGDLGKDGFDAALDLATDAETKKFVDEYLWYLVGGGGGLLLLCCCLQLRYRILCCCRGKEADPDPQHVRRFF